MVRVSALKKGHFGEMCVIASTFCEYGLRKDDLLVLSWARVRRVCQVSVSSVMVVRLVFYCFVTMAVCIVVRLVLCLVL